MEELYRIRPRANAELVLQGGGTEPVLPGHKLLLMLKRVTAHKEPVHRFVALVGAERELAELNRRSQVAEVKVYLREAFQGLEV